jgi:hypothetical protein
MHSLQVRSYEIKNARNREKIPIINGVHLHSSYDPTKEAAASIEGHAETLKTKNEVLVLGLGFGYHVNEIARLLLETHGNDFRIIVIEPNNQTYQDCMENGFIKAANVVVYTGSSAKDYYNKQDLCHFLLRKPAVIAHPASFNLYQNFFKSFLSYEAPRLIGDMNSRITNQKILDYLSTFSPETTIDQIAETAFTQNTKLVELDFLLLAMKAMTTTKNKNARNSREN